jgi:tetrahydromethanopterin S-methyltransferase subunit D
MKVLHGTSFYSLNQITKGTIKIFFTTYIRVLQIDVGFKNDVLVCYEGITIFFENSEYVKPPNESIASYVQRVICNVMGVLKT